MTRSLSRRLLAATAAVGAISASLAAPSFAQTTEEELRAELGEQCLALLDAADRAPGDDVLTEDQARFVARGNVEADCVVAIRAIETGERAPDSMRLSREEMDRIDEERRTTVSREVEIDQTATIEGQVQVELPTPQVDVDTPPAEVEVRPAQPSVTVRGGEGEIVVRQVAPIITVDIPTPTVRIEMPAPEIFVRLDDPSVDVATGDPQVEVRQGEPRVTVRQGEPELDVDLDLSEGEQTAELDTEQTADQAEVRRTTSEDGNVRMSMRDARVTIVESDSDPMVEVETAQPQISFESAEPEVRFQMAEADVEYVTSGEPNVTFETAAEREERRMAEAETAEDGELDMRLATLKKTDEVHADAARFNMTVGDVVGRDLFNMQGDDLGDIEEIIRAGDRYYMIVGHGGFFGIGDKEVALPLDRASFSGDRVVIGGLTDEQLDQMRDRDETAEAGLPLDEPISLRRVE